MALAVKGMRFGGVRARGDASRGRGADRAVFRTRPLLPGAAQQAAPCPAPLLRQRKEWHCAEPTQRCYWFRGRRIKQCCAVHPNQLFSIRRRNRQHPTPRRPFRYTGLAPDGGRKAAGAPARQLLHTCIGSRWRDICAVSGLAGRCHRTAYAQGAWGLRCRRRSRGRPLPPRWARSQAT